MELPSLPVLLQTSIQGQDDFNTLKNHTRTSDFSCSQGNCLVTFQGVGGSQERILNLREQDRVQKCLGNGRFPWLLATECRSPYATVGRLPLSASLISASHSQTHQPGVSLDVGQAGWEYIIAEIWAGGAHHVVACHAAVKVSLLLFLPPF